MMVATLHHRPEADDWTYRNPLRGLPDVDISQPASSWLCNLLPATSVAGRHPPGIDGIRTSLIITKHTIDDRNITTCAESHTQKSQRIATIFDKPCEIRADSLTITIHSVKMKPHLPSLFNAGHRVTALS